MKYLKLFESYYEDLTPYTYGRPKKGCLNVGWLDSGKDFPKGDVDKELVNKLKQLEVNGQKDFIDVHFVLKDIQDQQVLQ